MEDQDLRESLELMADLRQELSLSQEETLAFLVEAGIVTPDGQLAAQYKQDV